MNERIRELVRQAGGHFSTHNLMSNPVQHRESIELWDDKIEKFAELIVRECANLTRWKEYDMSKEQRIRLEIYQEIKQHFGVEE
jgi:hypothetical protein